MGNPQNRELLSKIFGALDDTPTQSKQGMKTTSVAGYPVFICWGRWGGSEVNQSGNNKGFIFLPYLQTGQMPLSRYNGSTALETPLDMVMSEVENPYNCKVSITPSLNTNRLEVGEYYLFTLALKPAAVGNGNNPTPYWDGWLKAYAANLSDLNKEYFSLLNITRNQWTKIKAAADDDYVDAEPVPDSAVPVH